MSTNGNSKELAHRPDRTPLTQRDPVQLAEHFARSGYFKDATDKSQAIVKMCAGEELGLTPMASMQGIHIIEGKPSLSANLLATLVRRHEHYDYKPVQVTDQGAELEFTRDGERIGVSIFTLDQAKRAGLVKEKSGWMKFPEAMCFARAMSQGVRWYCPDVTAGSPAYVPEELGAEVDEAGAPIESSGQPVAGVVEEPVEAEDDGLASDEQVEQIGTAIKATGIGFDRLCLLIGSVGGEAPKINRGDSVAKSVRALEPDHADKLLELLNRDADRDVAEDPEPEQEGFKPQLADEPQGEEVSA
jgi:hypothetical protein